MLFKNQDDQEIDRVARRAPAVPAGAAPGGVAAPSLTPPDAPGAAPDIHDALSPREAHPNAAPGTLSPNMGAAGAGGYQATPGQSDSPTPAASQTPRPFIPMQPPMLPAGAQPTASRLLFGRAGGMLGGGLGVPGVLGDEGSGDDVSALLTMMKYLSGDGQ